MPNHATDVRNHTASLLVEKQRLVLRMAELSVESNRIASKLVELQTRLGVIDVRLAAQAARRG